MVSEKFLLTFNFIGLTLFFIPFLILMNKYVVKHDKVFSLNFKEITKNLPKPINKFILFLNDINGVRKGYGVNSAILIKALFYDEFIIFKLSFSGATKVNYNQITIEKDWYPNFFGQILSVKTENGAFSLYLNFLQVKKIQKLIKSKNKHNNII